MTKVVQLVPRAKKQVLPRGLVDKVAKDEFAKLAPALAARGMLSPETEMLLITYCNDVAIIAHCDRELARAKLIIKGTGGTPRPHPLLGSRNKAHQGLIQLGKRLGILGNGAVPQQAKGGRVDDDPYSKLDI